MQPNICPVCYGLGYIPVPHPMVTWSPNLPAPAPFVRYVIDGENTDSFWHVHPRFATDPPTVLPFDATRNAAGGSS
jgi:hypothetical protein